MEVQNQEAEAALEKLLRMIDATNDPSTIRSCVVRAFSDPAIFSGFDQILVAIGDQVNDDALKKTLELFSYGSYKDYTASPTTFIPLTENQTTKLKQLTIIGMAQVACTRTDNIGILSYEELAHQVEAENVEDLVIACCYAGILSARLCQQSKTVQISATHGPPCRSRDVPLDHVDFLLKNLNDLSLLLNSSNAKLGASNEEVKKKKQQHEIFWKDKVQKAGNNRNSTSWDASMQRALGGRLPSKRSRGGIDFANV
eukprot:CAMPEP_0194027502 /NCGR_PEP_ID=MMETSP0009_2-20130614/1648_1 /TAXON_ID=210454 /ORGANISM="Grammatophora oceanica, Strain CCMP 410" /LENGTH=255 /DNA_ID=CAMNT_0038666593 /DNA_START=176 /DNA_END=943 /DNA_ORIENTATION=-